MISRKLLERFITNKWNLYGLQAVSLGFLFITLYQFLGFFQLCIVGFLIFLIGLCQRLLGVSYGMYYYEINKRDLDHLIDKIKEMNEEEDE